jgi:hypothetical protein
MLMETEQWQAGRERGLIWVNVPQLKWTRVSHDWELWRLRDYVRLERQIPVEIRLAIFAWLEQVEAVIDASREEDLERGRRSDRIEETCMALMGLVGIGLMVTCFLLAGGVL